MSQTLLQAWANTLRLRGGDRAIVQAENGAAVTFRELDARAEAWMRVYVPAPARLRGRAVVFALANSIGWFEVFLGLVKAGAVVVPLDAAEPAPATAQLAAQIRAAATWSGTELAPHAGAKRYRDPAVCLLKLTSGSTGRPQALAFTAEQLLADGRQVTATMRIRPVDLNYALIPFGHSYGLGNLVIPLLAHGVPLVCGTAPLPHVIAADFARWQPTVLPGVPALWRVLAASDLRLPGLRLAISAGSPLPPDVAHEFAARFGQRLHNFYGSSETGGITYDATGAATLRGGAGRALQGVKLAALKENRLEVRSPAVLTQGNPRRHGRLGAWLMPDRATLSPRGELTLLGRCDHIVKIAGRRVSLAEVTARLRLLPGVNEAWAGVSAGPAPVLVAVVGSTRNATELRAALFPHTAAWKIPKRLVSVLVLPVTARGKLDTRALQALVAPSG
jgi:acyl-coenzyme A synthetase/AMP-(fatty) acid ligase